MFFEMSLEEWRAKFAYASSVAAARAAWMAHGAERWAAITASDHYHGGEGCVRTPTCHRFTGGAPQPTETP